MITDCKTEVGITVGLIDSIITVARVLRDKDMQFTEVQEALKDLRQDEDVKLLIRWGKMIIKEEKRVMKIK